MIDLFECVECGKFPFVFEGADEYEPDPITGEKRCFQCDIMYNPDRWSD